MTLIEFRESLISDQPINGLSAQLKSLWYDGKGDWHQAHDEIGHLNDQGSAWIHAYLHRKEGDIWNADYWYKRANKMHPDLSFEEEWEKLVLEFLPTSS